MEETVIQLPGILNVLSAGAQALTGFFSAAGETIVGNLSGLLPRVLVALTVLNTIVALIGQERFDGVARKLTSNFFARYTLLPYIGNFFLGSPVVFTFGQYLKERYKPAFCEIANRTNMAPLMCLFPHVNPAEMYVWLGIYTGVVTAYGTQVGAVLAVCTFILAFCTSSINGLIVEKMTFFLAKRKGIDWDEIEARRETA